MLYYDFNKYSGQSNKANSNSNSWVIFVSNCIFNVPLK